MAGRAPKETATQRGLQGGARSGHSDQTQEIAGELHTGKHADADHEEGVSDADRDGGATRSACQAS